jgi:hypothetical protein
MAGLVGTGWGPITVDGDHGDHPEISRYHHSPVDFHSSNLTTTTEDMDRSYLGCSFSSSVFWRRETFACCPSSCAVEAIET